MGIEIGLPKEKIFVIHPGCEEPIKIEKPIIITHNKTNILELKIHKDFFSLGIHSFITLVSILKACLNYLEYLYPHELKDTESDKNIEEMLKQLWVELLI